jgi:hypothetical protein
MFSNWTQQQNKVLTFLKDHLNLVLIVPGILGGVWQILELSSLSISFVRFFSVTQLIADGLLILLIAFNIFVYFLMVKFMLRFVLSAKLPEPEVKDDTFIKPSKNLFDTRPGINVTIMIVIMTGVMVLIKHVPIKTLQDLVFYITTGFLVTIVITVIYYRHSKEAKKKHEMVNIGFLFVFVMNLFFIFQLCHHIHNLYLIPKNLLNVNQLKERMARDFPQDTIEIAYINDNYIFLRCKNKKVPVDSTKDERYIIIPFDELVKPENLVKDSVKRSAVDSIKTQPN